MDLEEWEFLPVPTASSEDNFLDFLDDDDHHAEFLNSKAKQVVPIPVQLDQVSHENIKESITERVKDSVEETDQDTVSQVHFKKMKETEFADMKLDSPKSGNRGSPSSQFDANLFEFQDKAVIMETKNLMPKKEDMMENTSEEDEQDSWKEEKDSGKLNILKWGLSGIGAICSFGVAAATVCIIALGSSGHKNNPHSKNEKLRFEIYKDKGIKEVVHHATTLNETITAVKGIPFARAHITFGGYYEYL